MGCGTEGAGIWALGGDFLCSFPQGRCGCHVPWMELRDLRLSASHSCMRAWARLPAVPWGPVTQGKHQGRLSLPLPTPASPQAEKGQVPLVIGGDRCFDVWGLVRLKTDTFAQGKCPSPVSPTSPPFQDSVYDTRESPFPSSSCQCGMQEGGGAAVVPSPGRGSCAEKCQPSQETPSWRAQKPLFL